MSKINDYDTHAEARRERIKAGKMWSHEYIEKPAMKKLLPDLSDKKVLMLGCGTGEESELLASFGATDIVGIDVSAASLRLAKKYYPEIDFIEMDMHHLAFEDKTFDFVYSSLSIHYSADPLKIYQKVARILKADGTFLFSTGHPARWSTVDKRLDGKSYKIMGYSRDDGASLYGTYMGFHEHTETFTAGDTLSFWVYPPSAHFTWLREAGFEVTDFVETQAAEEVRSMDEAYYSVHSNFPMWSIFMARLSSN